MGRHVEGWDRRQSFLLPMCLEDDVCEDNPVTVVHGSAYGDGNRLSIEECLVPDPDADRAVQAEPEPPSPYPAAAPQGDQLAGL